MKVTIHVDQDDRTISKLNSFARNCKEVMIAGLNIDSLMGLHSNLGSQSTWIGGHIDTMRSGEVVRIGLTPCWPDGVRPSDRSAYILLQSPEMTKQWRIEKWFYPAPTMMNLNVEPYETEAYSFYAERPRIHGVVVQMDDTMFVEAMLMSHIIEEKALPGPAAITSIVFDDDIP